MIFGVTTRYADPVEQRENCLLSPVAESEGRPLCILMCNAVIGLLVLAVFLSSGGLCAFVAPWVILAGTRADARRAGWQWWSGVSGVLFLCLSLVALLMSAHIGIVAFAGGLLCSVKYLMPLIPAEF